MVVMADLHGYSVMLEKAVKEYGDVDYVLLGDSIGGGPDSAGVLDIAQDIKAKLTWGNWELYTMAGLVHHDLGYRAMIQDITKPFDTKSGLLQSFVRSYEVGTKNTTKVEMVEGVTRKMQERGHLNFLARAAMFVETDEFIGIHAGLTTKDWEKQKKDLSKVKGTFAETRQIVDYPDHRLSKRKKAFVATDKTVITGHTHKIKGPRVTDCGRRVRLASQLFAGQPLFVWESWTKEVKEFS